MCWCCCHCCDCCCYYWRDLNPEVKSKLGHCWDISVVVVVVFCFIFVVLFIIIGVVIVDVHIVVVALRNLNLKCGQNPGSNSWDIADVEFLMVVVVVGGGVKSFLCQTQLLIWVVIELGLWQLDKIDSFMPKIQLFWFFLKVSWKTNGCVFKILEFLKMSPIFGPMTFILNFQDTSLRGFQCSNQKVCFAKVVCSAIL